MPRNVTRSLVLIVAALALMPSAASAMSVYQWKKRPIVVFAPSESDARLVRQKATINGARTSFLDRDVVVVYVIGGVASHDLGPGPGMSGAALRSRFRASEGAFRVLLVGKDGGIKLDSPAPIAANDLFGEIDRMPMRRDEIRKRATDKP
jgi:hypothetical protein